MNKQHWIEADWPLPSHVRAGITTRVGGVSNDNYAENNLALHVEDEAPRVHQNRNSLQQLLALPSTPYWLNQVHSTTVLDLDQSQLSNTADGSTTTQPGTVCAVMTADCLPLLLYCPGIERISAIHVGWRGFCQGIVTKAMNNYQALENETLAWMGPCISAKNYEVSCDVYEACCAYMPELYTCFTELDKTHWLCDMRQMISLNLQRLGVEKIFCNPLCTYDNNDLLYSYRRDGVTGRMAALIWMAG